MNPRSRHNKSCINRHSVAGAMRRASVLVVVLVVVMLLTLGCYTFTQIMLSELEATVAYERDVRSRAYADSGIEMVAAVLGEATDEFSRPNLYDNPDLFYLLMADSETARGRGAFCIVAARENDTGANPIRFGLIDESSKLNLNTLLSLSSTDEEQEEPAGGADSNEEQQQDMLMAIPNMTADIADAILDWLDEDELPRLSGAENEYYGTLSPPYETKNGQLESLDELLRVRGVTSSMLYGEDVNRNGLLDANENDGDVSLPYDNADGVLDRGWSTYFTVVSREANLRADRELRIDVNQDDLVALYDAIEEEFGSDEALFVTAFRLNGPDGDPDSGQGPAAPTGRGGGGGQASGGGGGGSQTASGGESRGGLNLSGSGSTQITSLYELLGSTVTADVDGQQKTIESPWQDEPGDIESYLPTLLDKLSTSSEEFIEGRINIAQAPREVLLAIPDIDEQVVEAIIGAQAAGDSSAFDSGGPRSTTGWLLNEGLVELEEMRTLDRYMTSRGDVYRVQSVGYFEAGGPATRLEAIIDATQDPPKIVSIRDLTDLGIGYGLQPQQSEQTEP
ncbi:MAG: hypothetical protein HON53_24120 [Planctomycetaceae bacterium]|jgi:hypothetical protein|nr:hypothetical protein [Planctomycetaceae bacterium]MBT6153818.1 hypothetical protein [Planctomycetaceae bacterium]MBT6485737.1 hypothetical protein [Planctomycetaceae bacterium]MBT6497894.1 hypothetical protein [Planctomycetaceae bacterium]